VIKIILRVVLWTAKHPRLIATTVYVVSLGSIAVLPFLETKIPATHSTLAWGPGGPPAYQRLDPLTLLAIYALLGFVFLATGSKKFRELAVRFCAYLEPRL